MKRITKVLAKYLARGDIFILIDEPVIILGIIPREKYRMTRINYRYLGSDTAHSVYAHPDDLFTVVNI